MQTDFYQVLGLTQDSNDLQVRTAYKRLLLASHPDKEGGSAEAVHLVNSAYSALKSAEERKEYQRMREKEEERTKNHNPLMGQEVQQGVDKDEVECMQCGEVNEISLEMQSILAEEGQLLLECMSCNQQIDVHQ